MTELERAIQAIEHDLLTVMLNEEHQAAKMELSQRMTDYKAVADDSSHPFNQWADSVLPPVE